MTVSLGSGDPAGYGGGSDVTDPKVVGTASQLPMDEVAGGMACGGLAWGGQDALLAARARKASDVLVPMGLGAGDRPEVAMVFHVPMIGGPDGVGPAAVGTIGEEVGAAGFFAGGSSGCTGGP